jgi:hypothetical protein
LTRRTIIGAVVWLIAAAASSAQEARAGVLQALKDKAVVIDIVARVLERQETEVWNSVNSKVTIPGRPVSIKLVGANVVVAAQFTPFRTDDGKQLLVAQGQVWVTPPEGGGPASYQTTIQTIPLEFGERVYFFPLGNRQPDGSARIEIQIIIRPYAAPEDAEAAATPAESAAPTPAE